MPTVVLAVFVTAKSASEVIAITAWLVLLVSVPSAVVVVTTPVEVTLVPVPTT
ncbi:MAG: hypothetical protein HYX47_11720 [Burkholderiales bacterium]|nr:hypothetical protein [Burkholderiales bacterium]